MDKLVANKKDLKTKQFVTKLLILLLGTKFNSKENHMQISIQ